MSPFTEERIRERRRRERFWLAKGTFTFLCVLVFVLFVLCAFRTCEVAAAPLAPQGDDALIQSVADGFLRAIRQEKWHWYGCGEITPTEEEPARARELVEALHDALLEVGLPGPSYLWASAAIVYQESRGNPCAVGPHSREWAARHKLVRKPMVKWGLADALKVATSPQLKRKRVGIDMGIGQTIWPENAKVLGEDGNPRVATPDEMVTVAGGARAVAYHMLENSLYDPDHPWLYWPGTRDEVYGSRLAWIVRRMDGPSKDIGRILKTKSR